jgi:hypothetical protein
MAHDFLGFTGINDCAEAEAHELSATRMGHCCHISSILHHL